MSYVYTLPLCKIGKLVYEKETLGYYFSGHPLQDFEKEIAEFCTAQINGLAEVRRENVIIAGMVVGIRIITTKRGKRMAVMTLEDRCDRIEVTLFSKLYDEVRGFLEIDEIYVVKGKIEDDDYTGGIRMIAETIEPLEAVRQRLIKRLVISVTDQNHVNEVLNDLPAVIEPFCKGHCPIAITYQVDQVRAELLLGDAWRVKPSNELLQQLKQMCGEQRVVVEYESA